MKSAHVHLLVYRARLQVFMLVSFPVRTSGEIKPAVTAQSRIMPVRTPPISTVARKGRPTFTILSSKRRKPCVEKVLLELITGPACASCCFRLSGEVLYKILPISPTSKSVPAVNAHACIRLELLVGTGSAVEATSSRISSAASRLEECLA